MVQSMATHLPQEFGAYAPWGGVAIAAVGLVLWIVGAKFNRTAVALVAVTVGGVVGKHLPHMLGWSIDGMGPAVGLAVVLGVAGFVLHRLGAGLLLGLVLAAWTALITWMILGPDGSWSWPRATPEATLAGYAQEAWQTLPAEFTRALPYACGTALVSGVACAILWPVLTTAAAWSALGVTLLVAGSLPALHALRPEWAGNLPHGAGSQGAILAVAFLAGTLLQYQMSGAGRRKSQVLPDDTPKEKLRAHA